MNVGQAMKKLPEPITRGGMSVCEALAKRRSHREFSDTEPTLEQIAQLCWAAQGITDRREGLRASPSAGALFPVVLFVVRREAMERYDPAAHALHHVSSGDLRAALQAASLGQSCVGTAPLCLVISFDLAHAASKYGDRAQRYCLLEAGHVAQNVLLQAMAIGLVGVPVAAFEDQEIASALKLPGRLHPVYLLPLGYPVANR